MSKSPAGKSSEKERLARFAAKQGLEASKAKRRKGDNRLAVIVSLGAIALAIGSQLTYSALVPKAEEVAPEITPTQPTAPVPDVALAENRTWTGSMEVGSANLEIELDGVLAPQAVANFVDLASKDFFAGLDR